MRIAFVVNAIADEQPNMATTVLSRAALLRGHDVFVVEVGDLTARDDGSVGAWAVRVPEKRYRSTDTFLAAVQDEDAPREEIDADGLDVLWLRYNPPAGGAEDGWARESGVLLGQLAARRGTIVLNHPDSLLFAMDKLYSLHFPESVRPRTLITRRLEEVERFFAESGSRRIVLKPLVGYGGRDVFLLERDAANLRQIVESLARAGFIVAQDYLPAAAEGDTRLFLVNGRPLVRDGRYAAIRRVASGDDFRHNMTLGGTAERAKVDDAMLELAERVRPRIVADGLFFVGLDIVGDRIIELNTISAGGLYSAGKLEETDFGDEVIQAVERKVEHRRAYGTAIDNRTLATLD